MPDRWLRDGGISAYPAILVIFAWQHIMPVKLELYGTEHCHLCEQADGLLRGMGVMAAPVDIIGDDEAFVRYELCIPVLRRADTGAELGWPFDAEAVGRFLR
jgi:hypothetical protein